MPLNIVEATLFHQKDSGKIVELNRFATVVLESVEHRRSLLAAIVPVGVLRVKSQWVEENLHHLS